MKVLKQNVALLSEKRKSCSNNSDPHLVLFMYKQKISRKRKLPGSTPTSVKKSLSSSSVTPERSPFVGSISSATKSKLSLFSAPDSVSIWIFIQKVIFFLCCSNGRDSSWFVIGYKFLLTEVLGVLGSSETNTNSIKISLLPFDFLQRFILFTSLNAQFQQGFNLVCMIYTQPVSLFSFQLVGLIWVLYVRYRLSDK